MLFWNGKNVHKIHFWKKASAAGTGLRNPCKIIGFPEKGSGGK